MLEEIVGGENAGRVSACVVEIGVVVDDPAAGEYVTERNAARTADCILKHCISNIRRISSVQMGRAKFASPWYDLSASRGIGHSASL